MICCKSSDMRRLLIGPYLSAQTGQAMLAVVTDPAAHGTELEAVLVGNADERNFLFQKGAHELKVCQGTAALGIGKAAGWQFIGHVLRCPSRGAAAG